uniref:Uncharacterized protein n=1 Tax=Balaenoptera musculus TaxID=9771 RepID=A0A8C0D975_BALMU
MGAGAPKARSLRPFASPVGGGGPEAAVAEQALPPEGLWMPVPTGRCRIPPTVSNPPCPYASATLW